jgi:hypothetical protein
LRLRAQWASETLDRGLADGADPDSDARLRERADELVKPRRRAGLAAGLERVVGDIDRPVNWRSAAVPVRRGPVRGARHQLMRLAGELRHMPDPCPRGVAMAEGLLIEPWSPLYTAESSDEIACAARDAADRLRPRRNNAHVFCLPTVVPLPRQAALESTDW